MKIQYDVIKEMLNYIYSGEINEVDYSMCVGLLNAANEYKLVELKKLSENKLCDHLKMYKTNPNNEITFIR